MREETNRPAQDNQTPDEIKTAAQPESLESGASPAASESPAPGGETAPQSPAPAAETPAAPADGDKGALSSRKRTALLRYMAVLFGVAFLLVLLSFLIQIRDSRETISDLNQSQSSALQRAQQLQTQNESLTEDNNNLRARLTETEQAVTDLEEQLKEAEDSSTESYELYTEEQHKRLSYELLFAAADYYAQGEWKYCLEILEGEIPQEDLDDFYPAAQNLYNRLLDGCKTQLAEADDAQ
jgi:uncharacterized protein YoxC